MAAPHPLSSLLRGAPDLARERLRALLLASGLDVRAAAASLSPPMHETTLHDLVVRADLRTWLDEQRAKNHVDSPGQV